MNILKNNKGFTLLELLVVVAIIGLLSAVVIVSLNSARAKGGDAAVKSNLHTVANEAGIYYSNNNSYLTATGGSPISDGTCPSYSLSGGNMFSKDRAVADAVKEADKRGGDTYCYVSADVWAVAVGLTQNAGTSWCVDSTGASLQINADSSEVVNQNLACAQPVVNPCRGRFCPLNQQN